MKNVSFWKKSILLYTILYTSLFLIGKVILNEWFALEYRQWIYLVSGILIGLGFIVGMVQLFLKIPKKWLKITCIVIFFILLVGISPYLLLIAVFGIVPEHEVEIEGDKLVGRVYGFLDTRVEYYQDVNFLVRGLDSKRVEYYGNGSFDPLADGEHHYKPIESYSDDDTKDKTVEERQEILEEKKEEEQVNQTAKEKEPAYEKWVTDQIGLRVTIVDYAMGKEAIQIFKTTNAGETWNLTLETENKALWVHYDSEFFFWTEQVGFIFDPGRSGNPDSLASLLVTTDGGKNFQEAQILGEETVFLKGLPYEKDGKLMLDAEQRKGQEEVIVTYQTKDQGITWEINK